MTTATQVQKGQGQKIMVLVPLWALERVLTFCVANPPYGFSEESELAIHALEDAITANPVCSEGRDTRP